MPTLCLLDQNEHLEPAVAMTQDALVDTQRAFDQVAPQYHATNAANPLLSAFRVRTLAALRRHASAPTHLLDLGCGPGSDAETLAREGYQVTGVEWSAVMVDEARHRMTCAGLDDAVEIRHLGIHELERLDRDRYDAVLSNMGPLNCVPDLPATATEIAKRLRPGGVLVATVIGRVVPWEILLYGVRGDWRRIRIRFAREPVPVPLSGHRVWTQYYSPRKLVDAFETAGFTRIDLHSMGLVAPLPYAEGFALRHRWLVAGLLAIEDRIGGWPGVRAWGDHFLVVLRKDA